MAQHRAISARTKPDIAKAKASDVSKQNSEAQPSIIFTGNRHDDNYDVIVRGWVVELPLACLKALIGLVLARAGSGQGFAQLNPVTVFRLRRAIDRAIGDGTGRNLIETGTSNEYRLTIPTNDLAGNVVLASCFSELVQMKVISREVEVKLEAVVSNEINEKS